MHPVWEPCAYLITWKQVDFILNGTYSTDPTDEYFAFSKSEGVEALRIEDGMLKWRVLDIENYTNTSVLDVPMNDPKVYELFLSTEPLGSKDLLKDLKCSVGTYGLPEFGTKFVRQMLLDTKPTTFGELISISGLSRLNE